MSAAQQQVGGVEVQAFEGGGGHVQSLGGDAAQNGVTLLEEGVEGSAQAVIVELVRRHIGEDGRSGLLGPGGDVDQGRGLAQACRQRAAPHNLAMGILLLRIGRQMTIEDLFDVSVDRATARSKPRPG